MASAVPPPPGAMLHVRRPWSADETTILFLNAHRPFYRMTPSQLQCWFFYNINSFRTTDAIVKKTQRLLLQERSTQAAIASADTDDEHEHDNDDEHNDELPGDQSSDVDHQEEQDLCAICYHPLTEKPFALACEHTFCMPCLQQWLKRDSHTCPNCRAAVLPELRTQLLHGVAMHNIFHLGRRLATTDIDALGPYMVLLMHSLRKNALDHPLFTLLSESSLTVLHAIGVDASQLTFKPYLDHMTTTNANTHGEDKRSIGLRITALCAINANGVHIQQKAVNADDCSAIKDELSEARVCNTSALWLNQHGVESPPIVLAHETMLKPDDCWPVQERQKESMAAFLTLKEASEHFPDVPDTDDFDPGDFENSAPARPHYTITHIPILSFLLNDLLAIVQDWPRQPLPKVTAALFFWSVLCANAANPDVLLAVGAGDTANVRAARGRLCNYHAFSWMSGIEARLPFLEPGQHFGSICTTDSIPLSFETFNTTQLKNASKPALAYLTHAYMTMHRATFRHVVHCSTMIHIDSASHVKLLSGAYELGILRNSPTFSDILAAVNNQHDDKLEVHPIAQADLLVWGYGRTMDPHLAQKATAKADTFQRLHSVVWVALSVWHPKTSVSTGGVQTPDHGGGSAFGKSPIPNDVPKSPLQPSTYKARLEKAIFCLRSGRSFQQLADSGDIRPVFPDLVKVQRLMASDSVSLTHLVHVYSRPKSAGLGLGKSTVMMFHVCGEQPQVTLPFPVDVVRTSGFGLQGTIHMRPPPSNLWSPDGKLVFAANRLEADTLIQWWDVVRISSNQWKLYTSSNIGCSCQPGKGDIRNFFPSAKRSRPNTHSLSNAATATATWLPELYVLV